MTLQLTGALIGAAIGLVGFVSLRWVAARTEGMKPTPDQKRMASIFRAIGFSELLLFPLLGYLIVPLVMQ
jgi:hypothetical protein